MKHLGPTKKLTRTARAKQNSEPKFRSPNWKGGTTIQDGRVFVWNGNGYTQRARLVMESVLGRPLRPDEDVHHKNGVKTDDRPSNLEVMSKTDHAVLTNQELGKAERMRKFRWPNT